MYVTIAVINRLPPAVFFEEEDAKKAVCEYLRRKHPKWKLIIDENGPRTMFFIESASGKTNHYRGYTFKCTVVFGQKALETANAG